MSNLDIKSIQDKLEELHAQSIVVMHTADKTILCDYMVLATVSSHRQMNYIANEILKEAGEKRQYSQNSDEKDWMLVDLGDVIVHIMTPDARVDIDLESLWANPK